MQIYRYMCIKNKLQITVHKIFKRIDNCMSKTSVIKYRKLFPLCLNLSYNKYLFIFASRLGHKTVRDNEVPYTDQRGKSDFFYISGFK